MYPNVTSIHAALDALKGLLSDHRLESAQIREIDVRCGQMTFVHTAWDYKPISITAAQMNMYYGLAVMAVRGDLSRGNLRSGYSLLHSAHQNIGRSGTREYGPGLAACSESACPNGRRSGVRARYPA